MDEDDYVTTPEAHSLTGFAISTLATWCGNGELPGAEKMGRHWMIPVSALLQKTGQPFELQRPSASARVLKDINDIWAERGITVSATEEDRCPTNCPFAHRCLFDPDADCHLLTEQQDEDGAPD